MKSRPSEDRAPALAVDITIESETWRMLPEAEGIVRQAIMVAATSMLEIHHPHPTLSRLRGRVGWRLSVLLCDDETIALLNGRWRGEGKPTNVLSFPAPPLPVVGPEEKMPLGDIAIAYETLAREAEENGKPVSAHLSHLVVHGFLHLLGYDHHMDDEAKRMERLERDILARIGVADPHAACDADI
jgi:probable rRNA maturation factor